MKRTKQPKTFNEMHTALSEMQSNFQSNMQRLINLWTTHQSKINNTGNSGTNDKNKRSTSY